MTVKFHFKDPINGRWVNFFQNIDSLSDICEFEINPNSKLGLTDSQIEYLNENRFNIEQTKPPKTIVSIGFEEKTKTIVECKLVWLERKEAPTDVNLKLEQLKKKRKFELQNFFEEVKLK